MTERLLKHGFERDVKNDNHQYLTVDEYKKRAANVDVISRMNNQINALKGKSAPELSSDEVALIKNQNDFLRSEIIGYREKNADLAQKANSDFVPIDIYDDNKFV